MGERSLSNRAELEADLRYVIVQAPGILWEHGAHLKDKHPCNTPTSQAYGSVVFPQWKDKLMKILPTGQCGTTSENFCPLKAHV